MNIVQSEKRMAWCFGMITGMGGCFGALLSHAIGPVATYGVFVVLLIVSVAAVQRIDHREFCERYGLPYKGRSD